MLLHASLKNRNKLETELGYMIYHVMESKNIHVIGSDSTAQI